MKQKQRVKRLEARRKFFDEKIATLQDPRGFKRPGSLNK